MKTFVYYTETKKLLKFIEETWPNYSMGAMKRILMDAKELIEDRAEHEIAMKDLKLHW